MRKSAILVTLIAAVALTAQTQPLARPARNAAEMEPLLAKIATYEVGQNPEVLALFTEFVQESMGSPALLKQIEARLLRFLQSDATAAGKQFAFQNLSLVATDASIPVLAPLLVRTETSQMARYALARIPGPAADEALRRSLDKATGNVKIGIVNSLGQRRDARSVPVIVPLISSSDPGMPEAAAAALAKIANRPALDALAAARSKAGSPLRDVVSEAYVECAGQFAARGEKAVAAQVYRQLIAPQEPQMVRIRAMGGLAATDGKNAGPVLAAAIQSADPKVQAAAIRSLSGIPGPEITSVLVKEFPKLQPSAQVRVLAALAERGDASARPLVMTAVRGNAGVVRTAALAGLGKLGDASSVMVLAEAAAASQGLEQSAARQSLYGLRGPGIDPAIVAAIGSSSGKVKAELITAAGDRGVASAADALAKAVQETDADVHREAIRALRYVAGPAQVPALLDLLLKASTSSDRRDATLTLAAALNRSRPVPSGL